MTDVVEDVILTSAEAALQCSQVRRLHSLDRHQVATLEVSQRRLDSGPLPLDVQFSDIARPRNHDQHLERRLDGERPPRFRQLQVSDDGGFHRQIEKPVGRGVVQILPGAIDQFRSTGQTKPESKACLLPASLVQATNQGRPELFVEDCPKQPTPECFYLCHVGGVDAPNVAANLAQGHTNLEQEVLELEGRERHLELGGRLAARGIDHPGSIKLPLTFDHQVEVEIVGVGRHRRPDLGPLAGQQLTLLAVRGVHRGVLIAWLGEGDLVLSTRQVRNQYPEFVVKPHCDFSAGVPVMFLASAALGGVAKLKVHPSSRAAFEALATVFRRWNYEFRESSGGTLACRRITGGFGKSLHAHGVAIDINPSNNPFKIRPGKIRWGVDTDMPEGMIREVESIRTVDGHQVWEWGGRWKIKKDAMHFQLSGCERRHLERGLVPGLLSLVDLKEVEEMNFVKRGDEGPWVVFWQDRLARRGHPPIDSGAGTADDPWDGKYGAGMAHAVEAFQRDKDCSVEGPDAVGPLTASALLG